jgi:ribosomal-protein-alanine N-acetyltransferase
MPQSFHVRRARPADLDALVALEETTFDHDRVSRAQWRRHLRSESASVLVGERSGKPIGCVLLFFRRGTSIARLYSIAVARRARGQGLGAALLRAAEREARRRGCKSMRLEVRTDNPAAVALYEKHGYRRGECAAGFYENGADAWRYRKALTSVTGAG